MARSPKKLLQYEDPSETPRDPQPELHIALHGLIGMFVPRDHSCIELHIPHVDDHLIRGGTFANLFEIEGHDYVLDGVRAGTAEFDTTVLDHEALRVSETLHGVKFGPDEAKTHARIRLPWPDEFDGVRQLFHRLHPSPLFFHDTTEINPRSLLYIGLLTYRLRPGDRPTLLKGGREMWWSDLLNRHTRLHFFADPPRRFLNTDQARDHFSHVYHLFNEQLFAVPARLRANVHPGETYAFEYYSKSPKIPPHEQVDLFGERQSLRSTGCTGNCLRVIISEE